jgi:hypothetical protein
MAFPPCIYQNGIYTVQRCDYYQQLVPQGRNIHPGTWHSSMYISEWDLHGAATSYYQQLVPQGRNIHPGHGIPPYIQNGIYTVPLLLPAACAWEKYTPRDMAFLHVYQNGIYTVQAD